jgi:hypothetical protein
VLFQLPPDGTVAVPFYERHGYQRRSIVFTKELG